MAGQDKTATAKAPANTNANTDTPEDINALLSDARESESEDAPHYDIPQNQPESDTAPQAIGEVLEKQTSKATAADSNAARILPHNQEIEQALLGALLVDSELMQKVNGFLKPEHFYIPVHGRIYDKIGILVDKGVRVDAPILKPLFKEDDALTPLGGAHYLDDLVAGAISLVNTKDYGQAIYDAHLRRQLVMLGEGVTQDAYRYNLEDPATEQISRAEETLYNLAESGGLDRGFSRLNFAVTQAVATAEKAFHSSSQVTGITTGLQKLDKRMGGLHPSDLIILAGRPSMGKTALATNIAYRAARKHLETNGKEGGITAFYSLEMSSEQLAGRILAEYSGISSDRIRRGEINEADFDKFVAASAQMAETPLYIDDTPALTIGQIRARSRRLQRTHGLDLIVLDYLQLLSGSRRNNDNRVNEVSEISRGLKTLAKELEVPVIALSQLSRQVEQRENKRPQLSDLRESGSIEQDADVVMFVYREEYYLEREAPAQRGNESSEGYYKRKERYDLQIAEMRNKAEVIITKQRHGPVGTEMFHFEPRLTRFTDLDDHS